MNSKLGNLNKWDWLKTAAVTTIATFGVGVYQYFKNHHQLPTGDQLNDLILTAASVFGSKLMVALGTNSQGKFLSKDAESPNDSGGETPPTKPPVG